MSSNIGERFNVSAQDDENQILKRDEERRASSIEGIKDVRTRRKLQAMMNERDSVTISVLDRADTKIRNLTVERIEAEKLKAGTSRLPRSKELAIERKTQMEGLREVNGEVAALTADRNTVIDGKIKEAQGMNKSLGRENDSSLTGKFQQRSQAKKEQSQSRSQERSRGVSR